MINDPIIEILEQEDDYGTRSLKVLHLPVEVKILNFAQE